MLSSRRVECVSAVLLERHIRYASTTQPLPGQLRLGVFIQPKICETQRGLYCVNLFYWSGIFVMPPPITSSEGGGALPHQETSVH